MIAGLQSWLDARSVWGVGWRVASTTPVRAGHSNDTHIVDLERSGADTLRIVLRVPAAAPTHLDAPLDRQVAVQGALDGAGIPVAWPAHHEPDPSWLGTEFLTMAFVDGHVVGEVPATDEWVTGRSAADRRALHDAFGDSLASVHTATAAADEVAGVVAGAGASLADDVEGWRVYLAWASDGRPPEPVAAALEWCDAHRPAVEPRRTLTWGDVRLGNAVFGEDLSVRALLDWETARLAPPEFDVGWWVGLESVVAGLVGSVEGFRDGPATWARWAAAVGRAPVDPAWFEVLAVTAATCFAVRLGTVARGRPPTGAELADHPLVGWLRGRTDRAPS